MILSPLALRMLRTRPMANRGAVDLRSAPCRNRMQRGKTKAYGLIAIIITLFLHLFKLGSSGSALERHWPRIRLRRYIRSSGSDLDVSPSSSANPAATRIGGPSGASPAASRRLIAMKNDSGFYVSKIAVRSGVPRLGVPLLYAVSPVRFRSARRSAPSPACAGPTWPSGRPVAWTRS